MKRETRLFTILPSQKLKLVLVPKSDWLAIGFEVEGNSVTIFMPKGFKGPVITSPSMSFEGLRPIKAMDYALLEDSHFFHELIRLFSSSMVCITPLAWIAPSGVTSM